MGRYLLLILWIATAYAETTAVYLTWYDDPTRTMAIHWLTREDDHRDVLNLGTTLITGAHHAIEERVVHYALLKDLTPDTEYTFTIGEDPEEFRFLTAPATLTHPVKFIVGGDVYGVKKIFRQMNQVVVAQDPLFAAVGGDLAYALFEGPIRTQRRSMRRWVSFLEAWSRELRTEEGRLIPLLPVAGNHDITPFNHDLMFDFFTFSEARLYRTLDFGKYLSLYLLDTGHLDPIQGAQTEWLAEALQSRAAISHQFPIYHIAAYPSHYPFEAEASEQIRTFWCPLFEQYSLPVAFEHHNHCYKKTYPIKEGKIDPAGVFYLGDGAWGTEPRHTYNRWYLKKRSRKNNVYLVELKSPTEATVIALDLKGQVLDEMTISSH